MAPFHSSKLRQLGGMAVLAAYLLGQGWWLTSVSPDDTGDDTLIWLLVGAPIAFAVGWFVVPVLARWINPRESRSRKHRRHRHPASGAAGTKSDGAS